MEYNWPLYQNSTTTGSSSGGVRGHNGHFSNPPPPAAWEITPPPPPPPSDYNNNLTVLKLGKRHYDSAAPPPRMNGNDPMCQVDGCDSVLLSAKEYHRRHKVCEVHAKAPMVLLRGIQQRFCQQCSRFHALTELDESKRSCRRRLAGHNQRRRKSTTSQVGRRPQLLNSTECALSLLSSPTTTTTTNINYHPWAIISDDLPARCSAALRELIAENRASVLSHSRQQLNDNTYKHASFSRGDGHVTLDLMQDPSCIWGIDHHF